MTDRPSPWLTPLKGHSIIVGTADRLEIDVQTFRAELERSHILEELQELNVPDVYDMLGWFAMGEEGAPGAVIPCESRAPRSRQGRSQVVRWRAAWRAGQAWRVQQAGRAGRAWRAGRP